MTLLTAIITSVVTAFVTAYIIQTSGSQQPFSAMWSPVTKLWSFTKGLFTKKDKQE